MVVSELIKQLEQKLATEGDVRVVTCSEKDLHGKEVQQTRIKVDYPTDPYDRETVFRIESY